VVESPDAFTAPVAVRPVERTLPVWFRVSVARTVHEVKVGPAGVYERVPVKLQLSTPPSLIVQLFTLVSTSCPATPAIPFARQPPYLVLFAFGPTTHRATALRVVCADQLTKS
jgi:hypothetical protein